MDIINNSVRSKACMLFSACALFPASLLAQVESSTAGTSDTSATVSLLSQSSVVTRGVLVREGDTLGSIARDEMGRAAYAALLAEFNNIPLNRSPVPGTVIRIPVPAPEIEEFAEVVFVKGEATLSRQLIGNGQSDNADDNLDTQELTRETRILSGDLITTQPDGYVSIAFFSGAVINLQPNTRAVLEKLACLESDERCTIEINTQSGRVTANINARDQQPLQFKINTPYASAAVRGTMFDVAADDQLLIGVTEGGVALTAQGENVDLDTGFGVAVAEGQQAGDLVELSPAPVLRRIPARIALGDTVGWWQIAESSAYEATISNDEAARETLTTFTIPGFESDLDLRQVTGQALDAGDYFLTLRAIDTTGLLGFRTRTRVTLADIDPDIEPVSTSVERDGGGFLVSVIDGPEDALGYEIQIASESTFSDPLSVDVNQLGAAIFRVNQDQVYTRARILVDPTTVSEFGEISSN